MSREASLSPSPSKRISKKTSQGPSRRRPSSIHHVDVALPDTALLQRHNIRKENRHDGAHASATDSGDRSGEAELRHALSEAASQTADAEDGVCKQEACLAAKDVAELAVERLEACQGEEVPAVFVC